jgi:hypothetical protein
MLAVIFWCGLAIAQQKPSNELLTKATDGARQLYAGLRDPESFNLDRVWIMHSDKYGDSICYTYRARNGFGGMNYSAASYTPNRKGRYDFNAASDSWSRQPGDINDPWPGGLPWFSHCSERATRKQTLLGDVTQDVKKALAASANP